MKMELPRRTERLGSVRINDVQRVLLLDSDKNGDEQTGICDISRADIQRIQSKMAIIIPVKDEKLKVLEGVISAIPEECLVIIVSNSRRAAVDRYRMELEMVEQYAHYIRRSIWIIHQKSESLGKTLAKLDYTDLLDERGFVRDGKAEGMVVGMLLAKAAGKEYVGFVDSDNYVPGAVHEYVQIYAASFFLAKSPYSMSRILWSSKPKILERSLYFSKWGRVSETTNKYLNRLLSSFTGFETEVIKTSNSGEHAMSMNLAEILEFRQKFAIETKEIINVLEQFGGVLEPRSRGLMDSGVEIFQIETRNPHFHDEKGQEHVNEMLEQSLNAIAESALCPDSVKEEIYQQYPKKADHDLTTRKIRPFAEVDVATFLKDLLSDGSLQIHGKSAGTTS